MKVKMIPIVVIFAFLVALFLPDNAAAWGPTTHILIGKNVLDFVATNGSASASLITAYPLDFLYGSIFADMHIGKKFLHFAKLAHNWRIGFKLLDKAKSDANRACAYGYLAHLAADTIAHTEFVPRKIIEQYKRKGKGHIYYEVAFDALLPSDFIKHSKEVVKVGSANNDEFLESAMKRTLLSFKTNRNLYKGVLLFNRIDGVRAYRNWRAGKLNALLPEEIRRYVARSEEAIVDMLAHERACYSCGLDPHGKAVIKKAWRLRSNLRRKQKANRLHPDDLESALEIIKHFHHGKD